MSGARPLSILDAPPVTSPRATVIAGAGTVGVHVVLVALALFVGGRVAQKVAAATDITQIVEIEPPKEAPAEPEKAPDPEPEPTSIRPTKPSEAVPAPAAAQAGQVLTAPADVVDFGDTFVTGTGESYAGGVTDAAGTSQHAVREVTARAGGVEGGKGTEPPVDRTRAPRLAGGAVWDCPFPVEADDAALDQAVVTLRVEVASDGRVISASATSDPGHGFAREARRCALSKRWAPGLDRAGSPASAVAVVNVRFGR